MKLIGLIILIMLPVASFASDSPPVPGPISTQASSQTIQSQNRNVNADRSKSVNQSNSSQAPGQNKSPEPALSVIPATNFGQQASLERRSAVANAVQALLASSDRIIDRGIGDKVREIAQAQHQNNASIDNAISKAKLRSGYKKLLIGADYNQLKIIKTKLSENQLKIEALQKMTAEMYGDQEYQNIKNQIIVLGQQNNQSIEELNQLESGFSLFGWLSRIINKY